MEIYLSTWAEFKTIVSSKSLKMQYYEFASAYKIFAPEGSIMWRFDIDNEVTPSADQTDFEDNHEPTANAAVSQPISGSITASETRYRPKIYKNTTNLSLTGTAQTIATITADGQVDMIVLNFSKDDYEVIVEIDGAEAYRLKGDDELNDEFGLDSNDNGSLLWTEEKLKRYIEIFPTPVDFTTSIVIKAIEVSGNVDFLNALIRYREKIT